MVERKLFNGVSVMVGHIFISVSYTHLDVYKRQVGEESGVGTQNGEERRNLFP